MRRDTFIGQVLTACARSAPATMPVRDGARPVAQLLTALARATPAFSPDRPPALGSRPANTEETASPPTGPEAAQAPATWVVIDPHQRPRRRHESFRRGLAVASAGFAVPVLLLAGAVIERYAASPAPVVPHVRPAPLAGTSVLAAALIVANNSGDARGLLPPSSCQLDSQVKVTCTNPAPGISGAVFQTYPSLRALYAAYTAKVAALDSGAFRQNFGDCGTRGEVGWTHSFQHTKAYTVGQMESGAVTDGQAAGRVFCNFTHGVEHIAWTQDDGRLLAYAAGPVHQDVYSWWVAIHHNIGLGRAPVNVTTSPGAGA